MGDLSCSISLLSDDVVATMIEGVDDSQLVVEWLVGAETQEHHLPSCYTKLLSCDARVQH